MQLIGLLLRQNFITYGTYLPDTAPVTWCEPAGCLRWKASPPPGPPPHTPAELQTTPAPGSFNTVPKK